MKTEEATMVTLVWETWLNPGAEMEGLRLTRRIWSDMQRFDGYISHELFVDQDAANQLLVVSRWHSREAADGIKEEYAGSETVRLLTPLLSRPRKRWVFSNKTAAVN
jgi:quinol monooxygenase YgiN